MQTISSTFNLIKSSFKIPKAIISLVIIFNAIPFVYVFWQVKVLKISSINLLENFDNTVYSNTWIIFGIAGAIFTSLLASIDYKLRKDVAIQLFGILLVSITVLDIFSFTNFSLSNDSFVHYTWLINRCFYTFAIIIGTKIFLNHKKEVQRSQQLNIIPISRSIVYAFILVIICITLLYQSKFPQLIYQFTSPNSLSIIPIAFIFIWFLIFSSKLIKIKHSYFIQYLVLSMFSIILSQLLMMQSVRVYDIYFNAAYYLKFISYVIPFIGIIYNYLDTIKNEKSTLEKLERQVIETNLLTSELQKSKLLLSNAEKIANIGSWELNIDTNTYKWSEQLFKIYGFGDNTFHPTHAILETIIDPIYKNKLNKELSYAVRNKGRFAVEYKIIRHDNKESRYVLGQGYHTGKENKLIGTVQDITELKEATQKLSKSEGLLREAEFISHNGSWEWHNGSPIIYWSDEMFNIHGMLPQSKNITMGDYLHFIHQDDLSKVQKVFSKARKDSASFFVDYRIVMPNNDIRFVITTAKYKDNNNSEGYTYLGNTQDVTVLRMTERELGEKINELNMSNKELEQFAYVASHDLQEPLRKIRAFGDLLKMNCSDQLNEEGQDYINRMQNAAERMQTLIEDLLAFSRATRDERVFVPVNLGKLINNIVQELDYTIESSNAIVNINIETTVDGIEPQLSQVFQNILSNALKFIKPDVQPIINVSSKEILGADIEDFDAIKEQKYTVVQIKDNGVGFDEKYAQKIFDMFHRLHGKNEFKGTGIGLAICKKIVDNHNGFIKANSIEGEGALFTIILPIKQQD